MKGVLMFIGICIGLCLLVLLLQDAVPVWNSFAASADSRLDWPAGRFTVLVIALVCIGFYLSKV